MNTGLLCLTLKQLIYSLMKSKIYYKTKYGKDNKRITVKPKETRFRFFFFFSESSPFSRTILKVYRLCNKSTRLENPQDLYYVT